MQTLPQRADGGQSTANARKTRWVVRVAGVLVLAAAALALIGWVSGNAELARVLPGLPKMKPNTSLSLFALGAAFLLRWTSRRAWEPTTARSGTAGRWAEALATALTAFAMTVGALTLIEHIAGVDFGLEDWAGAIVEPGVLHAGRMAPHTAMCIVGVGVASLLVRSRTRSVRSAAVSLALMTLLVGYAVIVDHLFRLFPSSHPIGIASMSLAPASCILLLSLVIILIGHEASAVAIFAGSGRSARTAQQWLIWAFAVPLGLGLLEMAGREGPFRGRDFAEAMIVTVTTALLGFGVVMNVRGMARSDALEQQTRDDERFLLALNDALRICDSSAAAVQACVSRLGAHLAAARCHMSELDAGGAVVTIYDDYHVGVPSMAGTIPVEGSTQANVEASQRGQTIVYSDTRSDPRTAARYDAFYGPKQMNAFIAVPLIRDSGWSGTLTVASRERRDWTPREVALVEAVAERAWVWFERMRMLERLRAHEAELRALNEGLEARVVERTRELTEAQERIGRSLREKEVLLREIHHRVKNNLQVVASLLSLQAQRLEDPAVRNMLSESQGRVYAIALIHEKLCRSDDLAHVVFEPFARALVSTLFGNANAEQRGIHAVLTLVPLTLSVDVAMPLGLILTELVSNALKHAFPADARPSGGTIQVALAALGDGEFELTVADDGVGLPTGFDPRQTASLGLDLVFTFTEQLAGTMHCGPADLTPGSPARRGTRFALRFRSATA